MALRKIYTQKELEELAEQFLSSSGESDDDGNMDNMEGEIEESASDDENEEDEVTETDDDYIWDYIPTWVPHYYDFDETNYSGIKNSNITINSTPLLVFEELFNHNDLIEKIVTESNNYYKFLKDSEIFSKNMRNLERDEFM